MPETSPDVKDGRRESERWPQRQRPLATSTIIDARGQRIPLMDGTRMAGAPATGDALGRWFIYRAGLELSAASRVHTSFFSFVLNALFLGLILLVWFLLYSLTGGVIALLASGLVGVAARPFFRMPLPAAKAERCERAARQMLGYGLCPSCAYDLIGVTPQSDGVSVCPECGGAWLVRSDRRAKPLECVAEPSWSLQNAMFLSSQQRFIRDDRRWRVPLLQQSPRELADAADDAHRREALLLADARAKAATRKERLIVGWIALLVSAPVAVALVVLAVVGLFTRAIPINSISWLQLGMLIAPVAMVFYAVAEIRGKTTLVRRRARRQFVNAGFCPSCSADLLSQKPAADGCVECPLCWAAWRRIE